MTALETLPEGRAWAVRRRLAVALPLCAAISLWSVAADAATAPEEGSEAPATQDAEAEADPDADGESGGEEPAAEGEEDRAEPAEDEGTEAGEGTAEDPDAGADDAAQGSESPSETGAETSTSESDAAAATPPVGDPTTETGAEKPEPEKKDGDAADADEHGKDKGRPVFKLHHAQIPKIRKTQIWVTNTSYVDYFGNNYNPQTNDDDFVGFVNYLNFGTDSRFDKWTLSTAMRVDTQALFNTKAQAMCDLNGDGEVVDLEADACAFGNDYRIERAKLVVGTKHVKVTAGDYNLNWSRGLALSVRKINDTTAIDPTIKGGKVDLETKPVDITAIGGVGNRQQSDYATRQLYPDPGYPHSLCDQRAGAFTRNDLGNPVWTSCSDILTGGRIDAKLPGKVRVGTHYAFIWFGENEGDQFEALHLVGGDIGRRRIAKKWDIYGGVTTVLRNYHLREEYPTSPEQGMGVYVENVFSIGKNATLLIDGKHYNNYVVARDVNPLTVQYVEAPTLEREDQVIPANANSTGGRVRIDYTFPKPGITLYANALSYTYALDNETDHLARTHGRWMAHGFVGIRWDAYEKHIALNVTGGYRWEGFQSEPEPGVAKYERKLPHAEFSFKKGLGAHWGFVHSIELKGDWRRERRQKGDHIYHFHRGNLILGYGLSPFINLAFIGGYSSEFPALKGEPELHEQPCEGAEETCLRKPHLWPGAELRFNFLTSSFFRIFGGRQVGGLLCVNGSCRVLPDFEGVRGDLVLSF